MVPPLVLFLLINQISAIYVECKVSSWVRERQCPELVDSVASHLGIQLMCCP